MHDSKQSPSFPRLDIIIIGLDCGVARRRGSNLRKTLMIVGASLLVGFIILLVIMMVVYKGPAEERALLIGLEEKTSEIRVFLRDDLSSDEQESLEKYLNNLEEVKSVTCINKEEALEEFKKVYEDQQDMLDEIEGNPFPAEFKIKVKDEEFIAGVVEKLERRPEISTDLNGKKEIKAPIADYLWDEFHSETLRVRLSVIGGYIVLSGLILLFTFLILRRRELMLQAIKQCPYCLATIPAQATKCMHCGSDL